MSVRDSAAGNAVLSTPDTLPQLGSVVPAPRLELLVEREGGADGQRRVVLDGDHFRIGSHAGNDLCLEDRQVSRFHCKLVREPGGAWRVRDLGSLNGTRIAGVSVRDADLPLPQCRLEIGQSVVVLRELASATELTVAARPSFGALYGSSLPMRKLYSLLERVSRSDASVLVEGESGTGKELVAGEIVRRGPRADGPFVVVDCAGISPSLVESTLFGHVRGAFTGAERDRAGAFESASGGTVFLDEIGELPLEVQPKLLRVLEQREVCRVGETNTRRVDVRIIAATNRQLEREVNHGRFREDLCFRLAVVTLRVPPLRARLEDLTLLVPALLESLGAGEQVPRFDEAVIAALARRSWPGNVRELRNYLERAVVLETTDPGLLPTHAQGAELPGIDIRLPFKVAKEHLVSAFERQYLEKLLAASGGNISLAGRRAGIDRMTVHRLLARYGLSSRADRE